MNKIIECKILMVAMFVAVIFAAQTSQAQDDMVVKGKVVYTKAMVDANINSIRDIVKDGNKENGKTIPVHSTQIYGFTRTFDYFAKFAEIEKVTGYSRDWFVEMKKSLEKIYEPKAKMETAFLNNDQKTFAENSVIWEEGKKAFLELVKNPKKAVKKK